MNKQRTSIYILVVANNHFTIMCFLIVVSVITAWGSKSS